MRERPQVALESGRMHAERVSVRLEFVNECAQRIGLERDVERRGGEWRVDGRDRLRMHIVVIRGDFRRARVGTFCAAKELQSVQLKLIISLLRRTMRAEPPKWQRKTTGDGRSGGTYLHFRCQIDLRSLKICNR